MKGDVAVCALVERAEKPLEPPRLIEPDDGVLNLGTRSDFKLEIPSWADDAQVEFCVDPQCAKPRWLVALVTPGASGPAKLAVALPSDQIMYWRATGRENKQPRGTPSAVRAFTTTRPPVGSRRVQLEEVDDLIAKQKFDEVVAYARTSVDPTEHLGIALRLSAIPRCHEVLSILGQPVEMEKGLPAQYGQIARDCHVQIAVDEINAAMAAKKYDAARAAIDELDRIDSSRSPDWLRAYVAANGADCATARNWVEKARDNWQTDPWDVAKGIKSQCPSIDVSEKTPTSVGESRGTGVYATWLYLSPGLGALSPKGGGFSVGVTAPLESTRFQLGLVAVRPTVEGLDGRLGNMWGAELRYNFGPSDSESGLGGNIGLSAGGASYLTADGMRHDAAIIDLLLGYSARVYLGAGVVVTPAIHMRLGGIFAGGPQSDSGLLGFGERFRGDVSMDLGLAFEWLASR